MRELTVDVISDLVFTGMMSSEGVSCFCFAAFFVSSGKMSDAYAGSAKVSAVSAKEDAARRKRAVVYALKLSLLETRKATTANRTKGTA